MGVKTVVHIFAEEFTEININRMFFRTYRLCSKRGSFFCCAVLLLLS